jgi:glucose/arabinose dehydrogenase
LESRALLATLPVGFTETPAAAGLSAATAMEFAPNGDLWVLEQAGAVKRFRPGSTTADIVGNVSGLGLSSVGERGLLGIAFDPQYATTKQVFLYYTATSPNTHNRISSFTVMDSNAADYFFAGTSTAPADDGSSGTPTQTIIFELDALSSATNHNGGAIHFGPDGKLYAAVGENANGANAQTLANLHGKMLRINRDGTIPSDNPFFTQAAGPERAIWALGLRNPFTFTFQPGTGRMFINDVGQSTWEEINEGVAGANYGWPGIEGNQGTPPSGPGTYRGPLYAYSHGGGTFQGFAITGGAFYNPIAQQFPAEFAGDYFFADFVNDWINVRDAGGTVTPFATGALGAVDLRVTGDGSLYYLARGSGQVFRVTFPQPPAGGPSALYRFDETSGASASDSSGNGHSAQYVNGPALAQPGVVPGGTAVGLNGINQYVALPDAPAGVYGGPISFETWFNAPAAASGTILGQTGGGAAPGGGVPAGYVPVVHLGVDGRLRSSLFWHGSAAARLVSPPGAAYNDGNWHHVAVTFAGGFETLYIDGVQIAQQAVNQVSYAGNYDYFLGAGHTSLWEAGNGGWHFFRGRLDHAALFQRALTPAEVAQHFAEGNPPPANNNPTATYRFDEASGTTAVDATGNGHSAVYVNGPALGQSGALAAGTAVGLNGVNQYVSLPAAPFGQYGGPLSFETWFNAPPGASGTLLGQVGGGTLPGGAPISGYVPVVHLGVDGRLRSSLFWHGSASQRLVSPPGAVFNDGNWHHVAVTFAGGMETLYVDGAQVGQQAVSQVAYATAYAYFLGVGFTDLWAGGNGGWHYFQGRLDEASLYPRALTASEVAQHFAARG